MQELLLVVTLLCDPCNITSYRSMPEQTDSTPFITASGGHVHDQGVALSRDLLERWGGPVKYGDVVYIEGFGIKVVNDTMNKRHKKHVDIWVPTYEDEKAIGWKKGKIWLIETSEN